MDTSEHHYFTDILAFRIQWVLKLNDLFFDLQNLPGKLNLVLRQVDQRLIVREYDVADCNIIKILENGDIECSNGLDQDTIILIDATNGFLSEFVWQSEKYAPLKGGRFFPEQSRQPREILDETTVQNSYLCSKASRKENPENLMMCGRFSHFESFGVGKKLFIMVLSKDQKIMYLGFRGSKDIEDRDVTLDNKLVESVAMKSLGADGSIKVHQGFQKRANSLIQHLHRLLNDPQYQNVDKVITCGHGLGAATAAMVHLDFVSKKPQGIEFENITFALPMFGNLALKRFLLKSGIPDFQKMHHFVNVADKVVRMSFIQDSQNKAKAYTSIGKYLIFHEGKLYNYPDDHQWIAQTLFTSRRTENALTSAQVKYEHSLEKYGNQLAKCYRDFESFDDWKKETDITREEEARVAVAAAREEEALIINIPLKVS